MPKTQLIAFQFATFFAMFCAPAFAQETTESDLKRQVYGTRYPWEHLLPYGDICPPRPHLLYDENLLKTDTERSNESAGSAIDRTELNLLLSKSSSAIEQKIMKLSNGPFKELKKEQEASGFLIISNTGRISKVQFKKRCAQPLLDIILQACLISADSIAVTEVGDDGIACAWKFSYISGLPHVNMMAADDAPPNLIYEAPPVKYSDKHSFPRPESQANMKGSSKGLEVF